MAVYRNQTPTMVQIQMLSQMRITTVPEAVAFLRAMRPINDQIAGVLQRSGLRQQHIANRVAAPAPTPAPTPAPAPAPEVKPFEPEDLSTDEGHSEKEVEQKVEKLKSAKSNAKSKTQKRKEQIIKDEKEA